LISRSDAATCDASRLGRETTRPSPRVPATSREARPDSRCSIDQPVGPRTTAAAAHFADDSESVSRATTAVVGSSKPYTATGAFSIAHHAGVKRPPVPLDRDVAGDQWLGDSPAGVARLVKSQGYAGPMRPRSISRCTVLGIVAAGLGSLSFPGAALPAFPGSNGRIVFVDSHQRPDGTKASRLRSVRPDGRGVRTLLQASAPDGLFVGGPFLPRWSPNGRRIVLAFKGKVLTVDPGGRHRRIVGDADTIFHPSWTPDGGRLLFYRPNSLHVLAAGGSSARMLCGGLPGNPEVPMWSARGGRLAFEIYTSGTPTLWTARTDGCDARPRVEGGARPAFSPDGRAIAFALRDRAWIMPAEGGAARAFSRPAPGEVIHGLAFSPDGRFLVIARQRQVGTLGPSRLFVVRRRDGHERPLRVSRSAGSPDWQPVRS
jgi:Tol biopolymer transport system component